MVTTTIGDLIASVDEIKQLASRRMEELAEARVREARLAAACDNIHRLCVAVRDLGPGDLSPAAAGLLAQIELWAQLPDALNSPLVAAGDTAAEAPHE